MGRLHYVMQHQISPISESTYSRGGGRIASDRYRQSLELCQEFTGLDKDTNRYDLLLLVKKVGKDAGFTPRMISLLEYYVVAFTRDCDWEEGSRPIVFQSLSRTALDLGVSERQIQQLEKQLFEVGAITWNDSGNHKRFGSRDKKSGRLLFAYGVDLAPLAYLKAELEDKLHQKQLYAQAWQQTKREISALRRQLRSHMLEWQQEEGAAVELLPDFEQRYQEIAFQLRTHISLEDLRSLLGRHQSLHGELKAVMGVGTGNRKSEPEHSSPIAQPTQKVASPNEKECAHKEYTKPTNKITCSSPGKSISDSKTSCSGPRDLRLVAGLHHISLNQVLLCASDRFREQLPLEGRPVNWNDLVEAAYRLRSQLQISQHSWADACELLGRSGAAICVLLTDRAAQRSENRVAQPAAYFRGMCKKARVGELKLQLSIFGLLQLFKGQRIA